MQNIKFWYSILQMQFSILFISVIHFWDFFEVFSKKFVYSNLVNYEKEDANLLVVSVRFFNCFGSRGWWNWKRDLLFKIYKTISFIPSHLLFYFGESIAESLFWYLSQFQILARQQAQREEELAQSQRHILALQVCLDFFRIFISHCPPSLFFCNTI